MTANKRTIHLSLIAEHFYPNTNMAAKRMTNLYRYLNRHDDLHFEVITNSLNRECPVREEYSLDLKRVRYLKVYRNGFEKSLFTGRNSFYKLLARTLFCKLTEQGLAKAVWRSGTLDSSDLFYISVPPFPCFLKLILSIKRSYPGKKVVLEYRDEWIDGLTTYAQKNSLIHPYSFYKSLYWKIRYQLNRASAERLEETAVAACDSVVVVSPAMKQNLVRRIPVLGGDKITCIPNGIADNEIKEFARLKGEKIRPAEKGLKLIYAGLLFGTQDIRPLLWALKNLLESGKVTQEEIQVRIYGDHHQHIHDWPNHLKELVEFRDRVSRSEIFRQYFLHDILLFLVGDWPKIETIMTGKIFELIESGRPIFALLPLGKKSCARELLEKTDSAYFADIRDETKIAEALMQLLTKKREGFPLEKARRNMDWFHRNYHYRNLCQKFYRECLLPLQ